jgi:hypothetical protein
LASSYFYESVPVGTTTGNDYYTYISPLSQASAYVYSSSSAYALGEESAAASDNQVTATPVDGDEAIDSEPPVDGETAETPVDGASAVDAAVAIDGELPAVILEAVPEEAKPDETKPDETKPDETKPDETKPDETVSANPERLQMLLAGMVGAQAMIGASSAAPASGIGSKLASYAAKSGGQWVSSNSNANTVLDRRSRLRDSRVSPQKISEGVLEKVAGKWLDGAFGINVSVEEGVYLSPTAVSTGIDWGVKKEDKVDTVI